MGSQRTGTSGASSAASRQVADPLQSQFFLLSFCKWFYIHKDNVNQCLGAWLYLCGPHTQRVNGETPQVSRLTRLTWRWLSSWNLLNM